ncbi:unnamed protein product [Linum tenue]|uniref:Insecticidal crystal toxin domain-containing protein n=1 Tax=Linum tenue TaxID=586396 RepID=A0AAV0R4T9_9ROSI|nr:unnamed protein product [Linum tenue]
MYVTRPLSLYRRDPSAASSPPPEVPNSGVLVIQDEDAQPTSCFGLVNSSRVRDLPFPQNKNLQVRYVQQSGEHQHVETHRVVFVPAINYPLAANRYYVIKRDGKHKGEAYSNSTEEEMTTCCFCNCISDRKPEPFEPHGEDIYQQFEISRRDYWYGGSGYRAISVVGGGFPPLFLRRDGWTLHTSNSRDFELDEALGVDSDLRARLPDFEVVLSDEKGDRVSVPRVVGKWYCPFLFVKESRMDARDQVNHSRFYEMTLEQQWMPIFRCDNGVEGNANSLVNVDILVDTEAVRVGERDVVGHMVGENDGVIWFRRVRLDNDAGEEGMGVGLSKVILERMKWEEERVGWRRSEGAKNRVKKFEEFGGGGGINNWKRFGYFVLAERFVLRRMDGSFLMSYEFKHVHQFRTKWE